MWGGGPRKNMRVGVRAEEKNVGGGRRKKNVGGVIEKFKICGGGRRFFQFRPPLDLKINEVSNGIALK